ncbi:MAG: minichromosome maintenance protein MCM, partial [Gammaproteobacteria bacterium]|nr:minichromosome maintenance protein MCM [Gammaproteobacteria bacterium]
DKSVTIDYQMHRVQELPEVLRGGRQPESLDLLVTNDLAGTIQPGDTAIFSGILRTVPTTKDRDREIEFDVNYIEKEVGYDDLDISENDIKEITQFSVRPDLMDCLIHSIAPAVFNMNTVKEAIIYHLFSGVRKVAKGTVLRGDVHVLLVGDPGIAKSQLLKYATQVSPRGVYTSGKSSSTAGLTAAAVKDDFNGGGWSLEVGALPIASGGTVAIDEMGQMSTEDLSALHEALEQQTITVAKAGIFATLSCICGALGAANPKNGIFDTNYSLAEQVSLPPALLSRFDVILCLTDDKDPVFDAKLASSILKSHKSWQEPDTTICIEPEFLRKYIAYARSFNPKLSDEALAVLKDFYLDLRKRM